MPVKEPSVRKVVTSARVGASAERALEAFLAPEMMKQWWGVTDALVKPCKNGPWALAWGPSEHGYRYVVSGVIKSLVPGKRLRVDPLVYLSSAYGVLGPMRLVVSVGHRNGRTRVTVRQDGLGTGEQWDRYREALLAGWKEALRNLKEFLQA